MLRTITVIGMCSEFTKGFDGSGVAECLFGVTLPPFPAFGEDLQDLVVRWENGTKLLTDIPLLAEMSLGSRTA